jgi:hypothetical protein
MKEGTWPSRRDLLKLTPLAILSGCRMSRVEGVGIWPTKEEEILNRIRELNFAPGSELGVTFFPRKEMWETAQWMKMEGKWEGGDESDWMAHQDIVREDLKLLAEAGVKNGRLVVVPFEVSKDGENYDWHKMETAIELITATGIKTDLAVGPIDYPYGPAAIRIPKTQARTLIEEYRETGNEEVEVGLIVDPKMPKSSEAIGAFGVNYLDEILKRYGRDDRIGRLYLGNEWPDTHAIEGVGAKATISPSYMEELARRTKEGTDKKVVLNTNIHPSEVAKLRKVFGLILEILGDQGVLGIDSYPTRESINQAKNYGNSIEAVKQEFRGHELELTEFQAELYDDEVSGKPWAEIYRDDKDKVTRFYQGKFPETLETYIEAAQTPRVGLWGSPLLTIAHRMGYEFPLEMLKVTGETMAKG